MSEIRVSPGGGVLVLAGPGHQPRPPARPPHPCQNDRQERKSGIMLAHFGGKGDMLHYNTYEE